MMFNLFRRKPVQIQIIKRDPLRVTMAEWRASPELTRAAARALADPVIRQMMDVLYRNHMGRFELSLNFPIEARAIHGAQSEGYLRTISDLESLAVYEKPKDPVEATYSQQNDEDPE